MKKLVIASAVAAVMASSAVMADTTVYGRLRMGVVVSADNSNDKGIQNDSSRFGFKGSEDLGNGTSAVYQIEIGYNADNATQGGMANRIGMVGLSGDFGTVAMGNMWSPGYNLASALMDPMNFLYSNEPVAGRVGDALAYVNKFGDVQFQAAVVMQDGTANTTDATSLGLQAPIGPVTVGFGYLKHKDMDAANEIVAQYSQDNFSVALDFATSEVASGGTAEKTTSLLGTYNVTANDKLMLRTNKEKESGLKYTDFSYNHSLSKRTTAFISSRSGDLPKLTAIGLRHDF
jgi:predicted porin